MAELISSSERLARIRPDCTIRVSGVELPEQTLIAPWMLPAEICERRRATSFSLSMTARRRNTARSITIDSVIMSRNRIGHMPHPPSWNASANILRTIIRLLLQSF